MKRTPAKKCESPEEHRLEWVVLSRDWLRYDNRSRGYSTPGHHTLFCPPCNRAWRTTAQYVRDIPDVGSGTVYLNSTEQKIQDFVQAHPGLAELVQPEHPIVRGDRFLGSVSTQLLRWGSLSDKQVNAAERVLARARSEWEVMEAVRQEREQQRVRAETMRKAEEASYGDRLVPEGKQVVRGEVQRVWTEDVGPDTQRAVPKMLLRADQGFLVECTVPKVLVPKTLDLLVGRRIELHARLARKADDWAYAYGRYPLPKSCLLL